MKKSLVIAFAILVAASAKAQDPIAQGNKCYDEKNYQCVINYYSDAVTNNKYQQKDYALIHYRIGYSYEKLAKYKEAIPYYQKAIERNPSMGEAYWSMANSYYNSESYQQAAEWFQKATAYYTATSDQRNLLYWKGRALMKGKKYTEALVALKESIQKDPAYDESYATAGDVTYNSANYRDAVYYYGKSIELAAADETKSAIVARHYWRGKAYFNLYRYDSALLCYDKALSYDPTHRGSTWEVAAVYYNQGKWPEAAAQYGKAIPMYADDAASQKKLYYLRGYSYKQAKDYAKAIQDLDAAIKIDPAYLEAIAYKAATFYDQKKYKEAIAAYTKAIEADADKSYSASYYARKAKCNLALKDTSKAIDDLRMAQLYDAEGEVEEVFAELGNISYGRKKYTEAITQYASALDDYSYFDSNEYMSVLYMRKGISNLVSGYYYTASSDLEESIYYDSLNKEASRYLAEAFLLQRSLPSAITEFTHAIRLYQSVPDSLHKLYSYRGRTYFLQKDYKKAMADYEQAEKLKSSDASYAAGVGEIAFEQKDYKKALTAFTKAIGLYKPAQKKELAFAYYARGRANHELKNKPQAEADISKAIELVPNFTDAKTWLDVVKRG